LRGAGPHGLAGIRGSGFYADKRLLRPLLNEARADLLAYGDAHQLEWLNDPSNSERRFARNRLRHVVMPVLEREFPGAGAALARVAGLQGEVVEVLDAVVDNILGDDGPLDLTQLRTCAAPLRPFVIKRWLARAGAPVPGRMQLEHMLHDMLEARDDGTPMVAWRGAAVRRYDNRFFLTAVHLPVPETVALICTMPHTSVSLMHGTLHAYKTAVGGAAPAALAHAELTVRYRQGGERLRLHPGGPRRALKSLFQEWRVPPWLRDGWPLVYSGEQLAVVPGHTVAAEFRAASDEAGIVFDWHPRSGPAPH
jgi:tRNA(Ile)-lysidine synthase